MLIIILCSFNKFIRGIILIIKNGIVYNIKGKGEFYGEKRKIG